MHPSLVLIRSIRIDQMTRSDHSAPELGLLVRVAVLGGSSASRRIDCWAAGSRLSNRIDPEASLQHRSRRNAVAPWLRMTPSLRMSRLHPTPLPTSHPLRHSVPADPLIRIDQKSRSRPAAAYPLSRLGRQLLFGPSRRAMHPFLVLIRSILTDRRTQSLLAAACPLHLMAP